MSSIPQVGSSVNYFAPPHAMLPLMDAESRVSHRADGDRLLFDRDLAQADLEHDEARGDGTVGVGPEGFVSEPGTPVLQRPFSTSKLRGPLVTQ